MWSHENLDKKKTNMVYTKYIKEWVKYGMPYILSMDVFGIELQAICKSIIWLTFALSTVKCL